MLQEVDSLTQNFSHRAYTSQALKSCQIELHKARDENRRLKIENETVKAASSHPSNSSSQPGGKTYGWLKSPRLYPFAQDIIAFAKKTTTMEELWTNENVFMQPFPTSAPSLLERYSSPEAYNRYVAFVLYSNLPPQLHQHYEHLPAFRDGVSHSMFSPHPHIDRAGICR